MRLTDEENSAESGIDVVASPPGKKLQNVLLLSGGEKALTALSLLVGIFQYQPSPFCILDEVDAPLDEANIGRFTELVREMACKRSSSSSPTARRRWHRAGAVRRDHAGAGRLEDGLREVWRRKRSAAGSFSVIVKATMRDCRVHLTIFLILGLYCAAAAAQFRPIRSSS